MILVQMMTIVMVRLRKMRSVDDYGNAGREGVGSGDDEFEDAFNKDMESNYTLRFSGNHTDERDTEGGGTGREGRVSSSATKKMLNMNIGLLKLIFLLLVIFLLQALLVDTS